MRGFDEEVELYLYSKEKCALVVPLLVVVTAAAAVAAAVVVVTLFFLSTFILSFIQNIIMS